LIRSPLVATLTAAFFLQLSTAEREAVDAYRAALAAVEAREQGATLEDVFQRARGVRDALLTSATGTPSALERLTPDAFAQLQRDLRGLVVNREEVLIVEPDAGFLLALAEKFGTPADRRFFSAYKATYPESVWPVYVEQQTDYSGCTAFGSGKLVDTYRLWAEVERELSGAYNTHARAERLKVESELATSTCACGDGPSVERELQQYVDAISASAATPAIAARLREIKEGRSNIRLRCISG
jgi:hypothetical protein